MTKTFKQNKDEYKVLTPSGFKDFAGVSLMGVKPIMRLEFERGIWIECTHDHKFYVTNSITKQAKEFVVGDTIASSDGPLRVTAIIDLIRSEAVYDLIEVADGHRYYANNLLSSNCEFIIFDETLIDALHLVELSGIEPLEKQGQIRWYKKPDPGCTYVVALDPSLGTGGDPAAIQVLELPSLKQIAEWNHNKTPIQRQIQLLKDIVDYLYETTQSENSIFYSVENNTLGEAALMAIAQIGEENFKGIFLTEPPKAGVKRARKGFTTTAKSKLAACAKLKSLIEQKKLTIVSKALISELKSFVATGNSYAAKIGETDDLVMSMLLAVRMTQALQNYDAELDERMNDASDYVDPMPFLAVFSQNHF